MFLDIKSPINLWKDYDVETLPLNTSALSAKYKNDVTVKEYYFDGYTTVDGRVRAFIRIYERTEAKGVILFLPDADEKLSYDIAKSMYDQGFTVAVLDYLGKSQNHARYTIYPRSLSACNSEGLDKFEIAEDEKYSRWYIWTCISRRACLLLKQLYGNNVFALGVGLGGSTVYKLTAFDDGLKACATLANIIPTVIGEGNGIINYHASLDNYAYSSISKVPLYMAFSSNDEDGSFDEMSELAQSTESLFHLRILERAFHNGIISACPAISKFFDDIAANTQIPFRAEIEPSNSDGNLYFNITTINGESVGALKLDLFVCFCMTDPSYRNWMKLNTIGLGENKFMAQINVCNVNMPIYAFANLISENGDVQSSALTTVLPKSLNIKEKTGVAHRKIYDGSMGTDCWTSRDGGIITQVQGPYGIDGVQSSTNSFTTFKPGDPLFKVSEDTMLQIMLAGESQTITISVRDKSAIYTCTIEISETEDWNKISLAHNNFKSESGMLTDWSNILMLEFRSDKHFVIGSVLWI